MDTNIKLEQVLTQLKDIHLPETPIFWPLNETLWWPPAPGWWLVFILLSIVTVSLLNKFFKNLKSFFRQSYVTLALKELTEIEQKLSDSDPIIIVGKIGVLLKKCALIKYKSSNIQSLSGHAWLKFLNKSGNTDEFTLSHGLLLITIPYLDKINSSSFPTKNLELEIRKLIVSTKKWIKHNL